jgi:hypothetical protein
MKTLKEIYKKILLEQIPQQQQMTGMSGQTRPQQQMAQNTQQPSQTPLQTTAPKIGTGTSNKKVFDFAKRNFTVSSFPMEKKLIFTPSKGSIRPTDLRQTVNQIKTQFNTVSVKGTPDGVFEIVFSPSENFGNVLDFMQRQVDEQ